MASSAAKLELLMSAAPSASTAAWVLTSRAARRVDAEPSTIAFASYAEMASAWAAHAASAHLVASGSAERPALRVWTKLAIASELAARQRSSTTDSHAPLMEGTTSGVFMAAVRARAKSAREAPSTCVE